MWLSYRDCAHLFDCCVTADYGFEIVYGISDNDRKYYSIDRAREVLGYEPQDNSAMFALDGTPKEEYVDQTPDGASSD
jgi:NAD+ dependent glucose-6-phosphate dehydrogenase